jgi:hypothetical protein
LVSSRGENQPEGKEQNWLELLKLEKRREMFLPRRKQKAADPVLTVWDFKGNFKIRNHPLYVCTSQKKKRRGDREREEERWVEETEE